MFIWLWPHHNYYDVICSMIEGKMIRLLLSRPYYHTRSSKSTRPTWPWCCCKKWCSPAGCSCQTPPAPPPSLPWNFTGHLKIVFQNNTRFSGLKNQTMAGVTTDQKWLWLVCSPSTVVQTAWRWWPAPTTGGSRGWRPWSGRSRRWTRGQSIPVFTSRLLSTTLALTSPENM